MEILPVKDGVIGDSPPFPVQKEAKKRDDPQLKKECPPAESPKTESKADEGNLKAVADGINNFLKRMQYTLQFVVDKKNGDITIKVLDENGKLIRQIPPEAVAALDQQGEGTGMILNETLE